MDCAKGINFVHSCGGRMHDYHGRGKATGPMLPSIGVPTTSGTGSEAQSYALIADGIESTADIVTSLVVWGGLRVSGTPADEKHPWGYGKAEALAGVVASLQTSRKAVRAGLNFTRWVPGRSVSRVSPWPSRPMR